VIRVLQRALDVLGSFDLDHSSQSLHDIAARTGLPKTTAFRVAATLLDSGYLLQMPSGDYSLSPMLMRLGAVAQKTFSIRDVVHRYLVDLALASGETLDLHVVSGRGRICIDVVESSQPIKRVIGLGEFALLPLGASGKLLLAYGDAALQDEIIGEFPPRARKALHNEIAQIRAQGYSYTSGDRVPGASGIAVPLHEHNRPLRYCITLAGPSFRLDPNHARLTALMLKAGREISTVLGAGKGIESSALPQSIEKD
jgi:DNA-binding IclR family transcriptional regulator